MTVSEQLQLEDEEVPITLRRAWDRTLRLLANRVTKPTFEAHIRALRPISLTEERQDNLSCYQVTLGVPSAFTREWVEKRHSPLIQSTLEEILDGAVILRLALIPKETRNAASAVPQTGSLFDEPENDTAAGSPATASVAPQSVPVSSPAASAGTRSNAAPPRAFSRPAKNAGTAAADAAAAFSRPAAATEGTLDFGPDSAQSAASAARVAPRGGQSKAGLESPGKAPTAAGSAPRSAPASGGSTAAPAQTARLSAPAGQAGNHPDALQLNNRYTFDAFVIGPQNRLAHAGAQAVAEAPGRVYNPLFLYGPSGLGKTHLMHAIGNTFVAHNPSSAGRIAYVSGEAFTSLYVTSLRERKAEEFRRRWRSVDLWLVDDIQFIAGKEHTKEEFFHTFNALYQSGKQIVICSDRSPRDLRAMDERLRSRFECGLIADIAPPDLETRLAILHRKSEQEGMRIPDDVLLYMARLVQSNIRTLEGALVKLVAYASLVNSPVTTDLAAGVLERYYISAGAGLNGAMNGGEADAQGSYSSGGESAAGWGVSAGPAAGGSGRINMGGVLRGNASLTAETVQRVVARRFGLSPEVLTGKKRDREVAHARQIAMHLMRELTEVSLPGIGHLFGGRDHSTVLHACDRVRSQIPYDDDLRSLVEDLAMQIRAQQQAAG